jgi:flagellar L-ring protein precursor FlgH
MRKTRWKACASVIALVAALGGCNSLSRLENIGGEPKLAPITNPAQQKVSLPMPQQPTTPLQAGSLWQTGSHSFFPDPRASHVGDIITVDITIADSGQISNTTTRSRNNSDAANLTNFFGLETGITNSGADPKNLVNMGSTTSNTGAGSVNRSEAINLTLAALVTQILPNGNMVVEGKQEIRVKFETREMIVAGIVRPEDIQSDNTIDSTKIAEARIAYGGRGQITDIQQERYGQQISDILLPF